MPLEFFDILWCLSSSVYQDFIQDQSHLVLVFSLGNMGFFSSIWMLVLVNSFFLHKLSNWSLFGV